MNEVSKENSSPENEYPRRNRIYIPPSDPNIRAAIRMAAIKQSLEIKKRRLEREERWEEERKWMSVHRKRYTLIGLGLAMIAIFIYAVVHLMSPSLIVQLENGSGTVLLDDTPIGRTGEMKRMLRLGEHTVKVIPSDSTLKVTPDSIIVNLRYALEPEMVSFKILP